jgi:hypothetical protein
MSNYKVKLITDDKPITYLLDGGYIFQENNFVYWRCFGYRAIRINIGLHKQVVKHKNKLYYTDINGNLIAHKIKSDIKKIVCNLENVSVTSKAIVENILLLSTNVGDVIKKDGKKISAGIKINNIHKNHSYTGKNTNILLSTSEYCIVYNYITGNSSGNKTSITEFEIKIYTLPNFELVSTNNIDLLFKTEIEKNLCHYLEIGRYEQLPENFKSIMRTNEEYILLHSRIVNRDTFQVLGKTFQISKKSTNECSICFDKIKTVGVVLPCKHREFCYGCVKNLKNCPICRAVVSEILHL